MGPLKFQETSLFVGPLNLWGFFPLNPAVFLKLQKLSTCRKGFVLQNLEEWGYLEVKG